MGQSDRCAWRLGIDNAPARVEAILQALTRTVAGSTVLRGGPLDGDHYHEDEDDDVVLSVRFDDDDASSLLRALGGGVIPQHVVSLGDQYGHHWRNVDGVELVVTRDHDGPGTWLIVVEYAEDIHPNNASWPLPVLVGEYLAAQLGGRSEDEPWASPGEEN